MTPSFTAACPMTTVLLAVSLLAPDAPQKPRPKTDPVPIGQQIVARDGDVVVVEEDARVRIVRRREANVRAIFNQAQHWLVVLADYSAPNGTDGRVDVSYHFNNIVGEWPLGARWEGTAILEDHTASGEFGPPSLGIMTPRGLVQILTQDPGWLKDPNAVTVLTARGTGRSSGPATSFDEAERRQVDAVMGNAERATSTGPGFSSSMGMSASGASASLVTSTPGEPAPVRVGGNIRQPVKLVDAKPVYPETARQAGIKGVVILEIVIDTDGSVQQARVLRSIPLLDAAAVDAARQWRFEPTLLNGHPVPVILTATVNFYE